MAGTVLGALTEVAATRALAEALLANGDYDEGLVQAGVALDLALRVGGTSPRRRMEAWTTLSVAAGLAETSPGRPDDPWAEAERLATETGLGACLSAARLRRLRAAALSTAGDQVEAGRDLEKAVFTVQDSGTVRGRREALHLRATAAAVRLRSSDPGGAAAEFGEVVQARAELLGRHHPETLTALHNQAAALRRTAERREALPIFEEVVRARTDALGADHPDTFVSRSFLALQRAEGGGAEHVTNEIDDVLRAARARLGDSHTVVLQVAARTASILEKAGRPGAALAVLEEWSSRARDALGPDHPEAGTLLHEYGNALYGAGRLAAAYDIFGELAEATRRARGDDHIETVASFNSLAVVASDLGDVATAEDLYKAMLLILERLGPAHALDEASVRNNLAHLILTAGRPAEARPLFEAVLRTREERLEPGHRLVHLSRGNLAATLAKTGGHEEALNLHRRVLAERTEVYGTRHPDRLASLHNVAATLHDLGRPADAVPLLEQACDLRREILGEAHPTTVASMRALADALLALGRSSEAEKVLVDIRATVETLRLEGDLPDDMRRALFAQYVPAYRTLAMLAASRVDVEEFFAVSEAVKARTLIEQASARSGLRAGSSSDEAVERRRSLERRIAALEGRIPGTADPVARNVLVVERNDLIADWRRLRAEGVRSGTRPEAGDLRALRLEDGRALLGTGEIFLSYVVHGDRLAAAWLGGSGLSGCADLGTVPSLASTARACRVLLAEPEGLVGLASAGETLVVWRLPAGGYEAGPAIRRPTGASPVRRDDEIVDALSAALLGGLPPAVLSTPRLLISTDGPLAALPFEALRHGEGRLLDACEVAYVPSLSFAALASGAGARGRGGVPLVAVGNPAFGAMAEEAHEPEGTLRSVARRSVARRGKWPELPGSALELAAVARTFSLKEGATLFTGRGASLDAVRALAADGTLGTADAILFSTHGYLDLTDPRRNALVLASGRDGEAGLLTAAELASYELSAELVVLSACDTGAGDHVAGEGVLGLPFAALLAGSRSVVQTLWPVFDDASAALVATFLAEYGSGVPASSALARVKRAMAAGRLGQEFVAPANWAPFLIYGHGLEPPCSPGR